MGEERVQVINCLVQQPRFFGCVLQRGQILMHPFMNSNLMFSVLEDCRNHLRMQDRADRRNKESRGNLMFV